MARLFVYDNRTFPDPDPSQSVDDVRRSLADFFPELANADEKMTRSGDDTIHTFTRRIGTKGTEDNVDAFPFPPLLHWRDDGGHVIAQLLDEDAAALSTINSYVVNSLQVLAACDLALAEHSFTMDHPLRIKIANLLALGIPGYERPQ